ncbi:MAG: hypothetical protein ABI678_17055 [Kofleriaceae bacterium]
MKPLILLCFLGACALDTNPADTDELAEASQASTVLDNCAVGHAANATSAVTPFAYDAYGRSSTTMNLIGPTRCDCLDWQGIFDSQGEAAANAQYPKCRPDTIVDFTVTSAGFFGAHFQVDSEFTEKIHDAGRCAQSSLHMELWQSVGRGLWQRLWQGTQVPFWNAGRCWQTVGENSPAVGNGLYRVKAVANIPGEQGYEGLVIYAGTPP